MALESAVSPMGAIWRTIRGYILWSYERGSLHYDIMVTLILLFVFVSPRFINFKDKPVEKNPHLTGVVIIPGEKGGFIYQIQAIGRECRRGPGCSPPIGADHRADLRRRQHHQVEPLNDAAGHPLSYKVWVVKE